MRAKIEKVNCGADFNSIIVNNNGERTEICIRKDLDVKQFLDKEVVIDIKNGEVTIKLASMEKVYRK